MKFDQRKADQTKIHGSIRGQGDQRPIQKPKPKQSEKNLGKNSTLSQGQLRRKKKVVNRHGVEMKNYQNGKENVWLGFDVKVEPGPVLRPRQIHYWNAEDYKDATPEAPFHYHSDALVGLSLVHLNPHLKNPFSAPKMNFPFCHEAWLALEPHHTLFEKSQARVHALRHHIQTEDNTSLNEYFERNFTEILADSMHPWGVDLNHLSHLIHAIDYLENKADHPLLYNFSLKFSKPLVEKLHYVHSMLFNLRALVALDYNAHTTDPSHEACKIDSISDYLSKGEYVANDGLLYYNFKKLKGQMKPHAYETMSQAFMNYSHNGVCLIESLPKSFLNSLGAEELEETLYLVQMDWLLGTDAGLLFKIREELYGLIEGYEKVFWPEVDGRSFQNQSHLSVSCEIKLDDLYPKVEAA
jgi:hypothetical protein